ncbi:hypothetical protein SPRG_17913 [Saprolegnia parasitica CBS 223.65]|uniref:Angiotensin-converting enzyme 2 n=1 Tax=Saprolegnia parasitica (strain CBS 223.65) TaxID=695850 RepID=A0A067BEL9_SAPPC|nr:hypothetical protein SPRG_17913 [Saprolegnia parasitica CBS 223.65]KDO16573.1 hypothetical protein SPRG_17913 [Saprolegnia parasitica CBS 223.65]|eukprot:XP_012212719.1 hypothetical protein SPRG_17913 [Saprolegnia parasitica CBS 223.65]
MADAPQSTPAPPTKEAGTFNWNEILRVQNLIERCLQQCMSQTDIISTLQTQANVDPTFTRTVWQKLEEQNPSFFHAYTAHLQLKEQILAFNYLVAQQREMTEKGIMKSSSSCPGHNNNQRSNQYLHEDPRKTDVFPGFKREPLLSPIKTDLDTCSFFT